MEKYHLEEYIINRYKDLEAQSIIDYESINKNLKANDDDLEGNSLIEQITINEQLYEVVAGRMPNDDSEFILLFKNSI